MITSQQQKTIREIAKKFNPAMIGIFGSYARNEQTKESDLDLLVDFNAKITLLDLIGLEQELSEVLGIKVDLVTKRSVKKEILPFIQQDLIRII